MPTKFKATINKDGSGAYTDVYTEANSQYDAEQIFKAQYPEHRIIGTHKTDTDDGDNSSKSGCAGVIAVFALLPLAYLLVRSAT